ncbi:MAG: histidine kinase, partial [Bacteroidota bacterium]
MEEDLKLMDTIITLGKELNDTYLVHQTTMNKQQVYLANDQPLKAYLLNSQVIAYADSLNNPLYYRTTYKRTYESAKAVGRYQEALAYHEQYKLFQDSISDPQRNQLYLEVLEKYENEKNQNEILQLQQEQVALKQRESQWKNRGLLALGVLVTGSLVGLVFYLRKQRSLAVTKAQMAVTEQQLLRAQMNPHFIFNALNSIKRLYVEGKTEIANDFLADFSQLLRQILERSHQSNIPVEQEVAFLQLYLDLEKRRLGDRLSYEVNFDPEDFEFDDTLPSLLLQPLVENSIWHGIMKTDRPGKIAIRIDREPNAIHCTVQDNGIGFYTSQGVRNRQHTSRGMELVKQRLGQQGSILIKELTNTLGEVVGTRVELSISNA